MFGLFANGTDFEGRKVVEKRGLFFPKANDRNISTSFEIRVFRAKARKRDGVKYGTYTGGGNGCGIELVLSPYEGMALTEMHSFTSLGRSKKGESQRMYTYALIDGKDEPYVTFKYISCPNSQYNNPSTTMVKSSDTYIDQIGHITSYQNL